MVTVDETSKMRVRLFPDIVRRLAPGPVIVIGTDTPIGVVSVMVPVMLKLTRSPAIADATVARSEPAPLSLVFVTVLVIAKAGRMAVTNTPIANAQNIQSSVFHRPCVIFTICKCGSGVALRFIAVLLSACSM